MLRRNLSLDHYQAEQPPLVAGVSETTCWVRQVDDRNPDRETGFGRPWGAVFLGWLEAFESPGNRWTNGTQTATKGSVGQLFSFVPNFHSPDIRRGSWLQYGRCGRNNLPIFYSIFLFINIYVCVVLFFFFLFVRLPAGISEYPRYWLLLE